MSYLQTSTFNSKVTEVENKIKSADLIAKIANTKVNTYKSALTGYAKKAEVATDITTIKNDYVTNASLSSQLNDLKSQHIPTEVTSIDNKTKKNASNIVTLKNKLQQKEYIINENERGLSFNRGFFFYTDRIYLKYECKMGPFDLLLIRYLNGNQKAFLIVLVILNIMLVLIWTLLKTLVKTYLI